MNNESHNSSFLIIFQTFYTRMSMDIICLPIHWDRRNSLSAKQTNKQAEENLKTKRRGQQIDLQ